MPCDGIRGVRRVRVLRVVVEMPEKSVGVAGQTMSQTRSLCQETVVKWFANYTMTISATAQQAAKSR